MQLGFEITVSLVMVTSLFPLMLALKRGSKMFVIKEPIRLDLRDELCSQQNWSLRFY